MKQRTKRRLFLIKCDLRWMWWAVRTVFDSVLNRPPRQKGVPQDDER